MIKSCCMVTTTVDNSTFANSLAEDVIKAHLAACVQIIPGVTSYYIWLGQLEKSQEMILQFKTTEKRAEMLMHHIKKSHSYETPEIIMLRIEKLDPDYEKWVNMAVDQDSS